MAIASLPVSDSDLAKNPHVVLSRAYGANCPPSLTAGCGLVPPRSSAAIAPPPPALAAGGVCACGGAWGGAAGGNSSLGARGARGASGDELDGVVASLQLQYVRGWKKKKKKKQAWNAASTARRRGARGGQLRPRATQRAAVAARRRLGPGATTGRGPRDPLPYRTPRQTSEPADTADAAGDHTGGCGAGIILHCSPISP